MATLDSESKGFQPFEGFCQPEQALRELVGDFSNAIKLFFFLKAFGCSSSPFLFQLLSVC